MMLIEWPSIRLLFAFMLVHPCILHLSQSFSNFTNQSAFIAFKSKISFRPNNTAFAAGNWSTTTNFCEWLIGVSCSRRRQRVTALNLSYVGLHGTISPHIANLSFLVSLDLANNTIYGFLPHEISHLRRLRVLRLSSNLLEVVFLQLYFIVKSLTIYLFQITILVVAYQKIWACYKIFAN